MPRRPRPPTSPSPRPDRRSRAVGGSPAAGPATFSRLLDEAARAYAAGGVEQAARLYGQAERLAPADIRAPYSLGVIALRQARFETARQRFAQVVQRAPNHAAAWHNLGAAAQQLGLWAEACAGYERALALAPDAVETRRSLAVALAVMGRTADAVAQ